MPNNLKRTWLTKGLPPPLQDVIFFAKGVGMTQLKTPKEAPMRGTPTKGHRGQMGISPQRRKRKQCP